MARLNCNDSIRVEWCSRILRAVLGISGYSTNTGGSEEASRFLSDLGWTETTWSTRASQVLRGLHSAMKTYVNQSPPGKGTFWRILDICRWLDLFPRSHYRNTYLPFPDTMNFITFRPLHVHHWCRP